MINLVKSVPIKSSQKLKKIATEYYQDLEDEYNYDILSEKIKSLEQ